MNYLKHFFIFLAVGISASVYGAYYISNIANIKTEVAVSEEEMKKEKQLFEKYRINEEAESGSGNEELNQKVEIFKKESPELKILRSSFDKSENLKPSEKIIISFEEEINIYSLLGFKKIEDGEFLCNGKTSKSEKKAERCESENKIFLTKKGEDDTIFKGVVKKSEVDKKTIILSTNLEELQDYELKITKGVKGFNGLEGVFPITKKDFTFNFSTTDKEGNIKIKEEVEETGTGELANIGTGEILEPEEKTEDKKQKEMEEWLKKKQDEIGKQETEGLQKASEAGLLEVKKEEENIETGTGEKLEGENSETGTGKEVNSEVLETGTGKNIDTGTGENIETEEKTES